MTVKSSWEIKHINVELSVQHTKDCHCLHHRGVTVKTVVFANCRMLMLRITKNSVPVHIGKLLIQPYASHLPLARSHSVQEAVFRTTTAILFFGLKASVQVAQETKG
jgi:hypothetical protein